MGDIEQEKSETLRKQAERALGGQDVDMQELSAGDVKSIIHELQVHQIELEMQNEELRRTQSELEDSHNRYSNLYDFAPISYFTFDKSGRIIEVNLTGANKLGVERSLLIKKPFSHYVAFSSRDVFYLHLRQVFRTSTRQTCELKLVDKNKNQFDVQLESLIVQDSVGNFSQCRTAIIDITERKRAEEALRASEEQFRRAIEDAPIPIIMHAEGGEVLQVSRTWTELTGYTLQDVPTLDAWLNKAYGEGADKVRDHMHGLFKGSERSTGLEFPIHTRYGKVRYWSYSASSPGILKDGRRFIVGMVIDVTERKRAEEALRKAHDELELRVQERTAELEGKNMELGAEINKCKQAEEKIREQAALLDNAQEAVGVRSLEHRLIYWNKGAQRLYGFSAEEALGKNPVEFLFKDKEEPSQLISAKRIVLEKGEWTGELHQKTKDAREIVVESHWTLVCDSEGKPKSILVVNTDITEKKRLEEQALRAQRMESIGTLAGGIAHDLNNMLTPMMLSLQTLKEKFKDEQSQRLLTILEQNSQRSANLIKQIMSFSRGIEGERKPLAVTHLISEIEKIARETFPKGIEIKRDVPDNLWAISGDATQLHQVIMNLCLNARDAMPDGGVLSITALNFLIDENYARMHDEAKVGSYVVITVSDTGTGIPPKIMGRIFEPFFTTKEHGKGTGLGLPTALAIVKGHGGFITVYSEVGKGTAVRVYLPAIRTEIQETQEQQLELLVGNGEWILVAEDEESIRDVTFSTLEMSGYKVLMANDGADAVALYAENMDRIKVVLMDMMMPVMDGQAGIRAIRRVNPEVKIIAVSGLAEKDRLAKVEGIANAFLPKPYTAERLLKTISEVLSTR
ncbi:MAG: PAS domain S-box protein [Candidatus Methanoperedens sp.]|nr:PAS domain S-box protein [Candidatus Methanoperedens sp.]